MRIAGLGLALMTAACATAPAPMPRAAMPAATGPADTPPQTAQYLYGSAEAAALSHQAYNLLVDRVRAKLAARAIHDVGAPLSVVLAPGATLAAPRFAECGDRPPAVVLDADETTILNLGYQYGDARSGRAYDDARWQRWERTGGDRVVAVPGAREAFAALRAMGVAIVLNTNRRAAYAAETEQALARSGLGAFRHGETLWLRGDAGDDRSAKDARRTAIAARYCVLAMAGDQLSDFSDGFTGAAPARRTAAQAPAIAALWGRGWFVLPNPVYGAGLGSSWDETFPPDTRWTDPAGETR